MKIAIKDSALGLRDSTTRLPFRYGKACLTACPQAVYQVVIEADGGLQSGYSGDCLPPSWFDKTPGKDFAAQIDEMLWVIAAADREFRQTLSQPGDFFRAWHDVLKRVQAACRERGLPPLLASFGVSMAERALIDAVCRAARVSFARAVRENLLGINPGLVHPELDKLTPRDWLPDRPVDSIYVRHTIGLSDPLTTADVPDDDRLYDGFPQSLEVYITRCGLRYFKIKVSNQPDHDIARLEQVAGVVERHCGECYGVTLDGNEQYADAAEFDALIDAVRSNARLETLWQNTIAIEQPLDRGIALSKEHTGGIRELSKTKPVIIDESDGSLDAYVRALDLGYRGVSSKNCKGPIKSLLNAGLTWLRNDRGARNDFVMTAEDLCCVGVVPVQSDLCLVATLGLEHVERNGHHYHRGLSYLPEEEQSRALDAHADLYAMQHGVVAPRMVDGRFDMRSLQCIGFGFRAEPDMKAMKLHELRA